MVMDEEVNGDGVKISRISKEFISQPLSFSLRRWGLAQHCGMMLGRESGSQGSLNPVSPFANNTTQAANRNFEIDFGTPPLATPSSSQDSVSGALSPPRPTSEGDVLDVFVPTIQSQDQEMNFGIDPRVLQITSQGSAMASSTNTSRPTQHTLHDQLERLNGKFPTTTQPINQEDGVNSGTASPRPTKSTFHVQPERLNGRAPTTRQLVNQENGISSSTMSPRPAQTGAHGEGFNNSTKPPSTNPTDQETATKPAAAPVPKNVQVTSMEDGSDTDAHFNAYLASQISQGSNQTSSSPETSVDSSPSLSMDWVFATLPEIEPAKKDISDEMMAKLLPGPNESIDEILDNYYS